jgi:hypothetical protein
MANQTNLMQVSVPNNEGIVGTPTVFIFEFDQQIVASKLKVTFNIYEDKVIKESRNIIKPLKPVSGSLKKGTAELTFPEALAGAVLDIKFSFTGKIQSLPASISIKIKKKNGTVDVEEIEKVYWSEQELASFGTTLPHKREIYKNEWAFLHIYTKGMSGYNLLAQIREYDNEKDIRPIKNIGVVMRDNVVSIPYSMASAITDFKSKYKTIFEKECLELYARAHPDKTKIDSGKKSPNLFLHYKKEEKNPVKPTTVPPVKVIIAEEEGEKEIKTKARCSLEFRPNNSYIGDYGFDWIRKGDTGAPQPFNDHTFRDYMGKHYHVATNKVETNGNKTGDSFKYDKDTNSIVLNPNTNILDNSFGDGTMYNRSKKRFKPLVFSWKDSSGKPFETHTPIMTLMQGKAAELDLFLDIKTIPEKIVFELSNPQAANYLTLNKTEINSGFSEGVDKTTHKLVITCNGEFDDEYILYARAFGKNDPKGEICGILRILPNGQMYQHRIKIVLFSIKTNINGIDNYGKNSPSYRKDRINQILNQALVISDIEEVDLDTTKNRNFRRDYCKLIGSNYVIAGDRTRSWNLRTYLESSRDSKYDHYYKIYYFDEEEAGRNGYSWDYKYAVCFNTANSEQESTNFFMPWSWHILLTDTATIQNLHINIEQRITSWIIVTI